MSKILEIPRENLNTCHSFSYQQNAIEAINSTDIENLILKNKP